MVGQRFSGLPLRLRLSLSPPFGLAFSLAFDLFRLGFCLGFRLGFRLRLRFGLFPRPWLRCRGACFTAGGCRSCGLRRRSWFSSGCSPSCVSFRPRDRFGGIMANNWCRKVVEDNDALDG